jgi:DNA-directed RNA polymerase subunit RPC12/RpoP
VCDFIDTARNAQVTLLNRSIQLDRIATEQSMKGFMHKEIKSEPKSTSDDECKSLEMEVSVDPMLVLQNSEESQISPSTDDNCSCVDVTHLHDVDSENVTIKLIKKRDKYCDSSEDEKKDYNSKPFPCATCKRGFYTELALKNHNWIHNDDDKETRLFKCSACSEDFEYKSDLINHLKTHKTTGICQLCGRKLVFVF